ncbi:Phytochrome, two-component sensor histidine kinase [Mesoflavibacter sp. HG96]|uniref:histidine kinase n=1 Tax=Mesoflavibacter profundi TaxID=2708110 RepID=A0ABT4RXH5_9FLAO|nr:MULTISPECIES: ATP-binding protein [Mesoflavibacter]MDA0176523.1 ATP-binding protein [Mesoflavibacter profundi]QIJ90161.1 Phytochrome, two-component sensor histidine kinase [Mesoflavibacter sp. HG96]QIJ92889.1 Phytochrome, two-component sensor histidine kinase [Mesoflavibacter sp. HG37]
MKSYPKITDINKCEDEPIHLIPNVQQFGCLLVLDYKDTIIQCSNNTIDILNIASQELLGTKIDKHISLDLKNTSGNNPIITTCNTIPILINVHEYESYVILDIEQLSDTDWDQFQFQQYMINSLNNLSNCNNLTDLSNNITQTTKDLFDYDRVMLYKFDEHWNGQIIAETKEEHLTSWLGINYPATDIPANARQLFLKQGVRVISNVEETNAALTPTVNCVTNSLTDISKSHFRAASPFHIEYLKNMKVSATLTCAIVNDDKLWGLIACHNYSAKSLSFQKRQACLLYSKMISNQISIKQSNFYLQKINNHSTVRLKLVENMSEKWDLIKGLTQHNVTGLNLLESDSFIIAYNDTIYNLGNTLEQTILKKLIKELEQLTKQSDYFISNNISEDINWLKTYSKDISGVMYFRISKKSNESVLWIRKEKIDTKIWGGNLDKINIEKETNSRLSPRKSFEKWSQYVKHTAIKWEAHEVSAAKALVNDIKNIIVTKFSEVNKLNKQLRNLNQELESFSYSVSHDLRGPLRGIDGFANILKEDYFDVLDDFGKESVETIINSAEKMNSLMDDILSYSGLSKVDKIDDYHNLNNIISDVLKDNDLLKNNPKTNIIINPNLPEIFGDKMMIYQLISNLITNAFKYSSKVDNPKIEIDYYNDGEKNIYFVKDNGIGFKPEYSKKIFGVFMRLTNKDYSGTGVGLAIAQRIVYRHSGDIWAESQLNKGAKFNFYFGQNEKRIKG